VRLTFDAAPAFVDLSAGMPPVWDQGDSDSCVDHAESALGDGEPADVNDLQACLSAGLPVAFGCTLFESFGLDQTVVETPAQGERVAGPHCMVVVGIGFGHEWAEFPDADPDTRYVKVRNSWGTDAHLDGHLLMPVSYLLAHAADFWTTRSA
jgi:C1A family cysteine protease